jgi:hypothetical protein
MNLLQEEFSFDQIYIDAIRLKTIEDAGLDKLGEEFVSVPGLFCPKRSCCFPFRIQHRCQNLINTS